MKYMNKFNDKFKFRLPRSYWGSAHAMLSTSDELHAVNKKADK